MVILNNKCITMSNMCIIFNRWKSVFPTLYFKITSLVKQVITNCNITTCIIPSIQYEYIFQSEDEALARALAESEHMTNENTTSPQPRCSVA